MIAPIPFQRTLQVAQRYTALGYHVIPCFPRSKRPMVPWKLYQTVAPTESELTAWFVDRSEMNLAFVMGRGTCAVDLDGGSLAEQLLLDAGIVLPPEAPRSRTGGGGFHVLLKGTCADRIGLFRAERDMIARVDIRGVGIIVVPPSIHPNGCEYQWERSPCGVTELPLAPSSLLVRVSRGRRIADGPLRSAA